MKKIFLLFLIVFVFSLVSYFVAFDTGWECGIKITVDEIYRHENGYSIRNAKIEMPGVILDDIVHSAGARIPFQFNLRGDGRYLFRYSDNVSKVGIWSKQTKVYEGPPISTHNVGIGILGVDVYAEGKAYFEAINRCSIHSFFKSFF